MTDFLVKYRSPKPQNPRESAESILNRLSEQLYKEWKARGILTYVTTSHSIDGGEMTISLNLMSGTDEKQYFYRLIEIVQPLDKDYPVLISAFQNPPTEEKKIESPVDLETELVEILGSERVEYILKHIEHMGSLIRSWKKEDETDSSEEES